MQEGAVRLPLEPGTRSVLCRIATGSTANSTPSVLPRAWQAVIARHEALRASFCWNVGEGMLQVIHTPGRTPIEYLDWSAIAETEQEPKLQALLKKRA